MLRRSIISISIAGRTTGAFMRIFGPFLEQRWGQPIVLDLKPGGGAAIGFNSAANAAPDGYLRPNGAVVAGVAFGRPYQLPFSVR